MKNKLNRIVAVMGSALFLGGLVATVFAFQSTQIEPLTMEVTVGGVAPQAPTGFQIIHTPLQGVSQVTKLAIVKGTVGTDVGQGIHSSAVGDLLIRVTLRFRFFQQG